MKTLIVGTGIIGVLYGWSLSQAGIDVTHFVRPGNADQLSKDVILDLLDERKGHPLKSIQKYSIHYVEKVSPEDGYELVIIPTKGQQVGAAIKMLAPLTGDATILIFSGNWEGLFDYDAAMMRNRYLLGYPDGGGAVCNGVYWANIGSEVHLGLLEGQSAARLDSVNKLFVRADMKPDIQEDILHWLWVHNAGVIGFAAGLAKYRQLEPYLKDKALVYQSICATKELYGLCAYRGVDLGRYPEVGFIKLPIWLTALLLKRNFQRNESMQRYTAHATSESNIRETMYFYEQIIRMANDLEFDMPNLKVLGAYLKIPAEYDPLLPAVN
jgi:ketopantoate reductase